MLVILSGQYLESELASEFGAIPPSFLPVGNKRLYSYQVSQFREYYKDIILTLPHDFALDEADRAELERLRVRLYRTHSAATLGQAVRQLLGEITRDGRIDILYGDTLIHDTDLQGSDWLAVGDSDEFYQWHYEKTQGEEGGAAWCGMFSFADSACLRSRLDEEPDFIAAVEDYVGRDGRLERRRVRQWLDFGHVHTYFTSKLSATTQRHFNQLSIANGVLTKSSDDQRKMAAEAAWFEKAPPCVRHFLPNYIGSPGGEGVRYSLEYLPLAALNELFVFGRLPAKVWNKILGACGQFLEAAAAIPVPERIGTDVVQATYVDKTFKRLAEFSAQTGISLDEPWRVNGQCVPSLRAMAEEMGDAVMSHAAVPSFIHGDLCFSNILFDFRCGRVKLIDPRGMDAHGSITPYGDLRYDIGKLSHSVLGLYDLLIAGHFQLEVRGQEVDYAILDGQTAAVREMFMQNPILGRLPSQWDCYPVMVLLFLSMLPLHADNPRRQKALMANSMRLYLESRP
jgi:hypothetical protein